jgi:Tfp pilus assembly protein PilZ
MWQAPNQRIRALAQQKKREREKRGKGRLYLKRVVGELRLPAETLGGTSQTMLARVMLNDLSVKGVSAFSPEQLQIGQPVQLTIDQPRKFFVRGRVVWSQAVGQESHIISTTPFSYRIGIEFQLTSPEEEAEVRRFVEELARDFLMPQAA